ncbi:phage holin family protein [Pseudomonas aeruginosa]
MRLISARQAWHDAFYESRSSVLALSISLAVLMARHATPISPYLLAVLVVLLVLVYRNKGNIAPILRLS